MVNPRYLAKIENYLQPYYLDYIAVINTAALQIKNGFLGYLIGDR